MAEPGLSSSKKVFPGIFPTASHRWGSSLDPSSSPLGAPFSHVWYLLPLSNFHGPLLCYMISDQWVSWKLPGILIISPYVNGTL